jgi:O-antigen/teichoic acid export membrane protein
MSLENRTDTNLTMEPSHAGKRSNAPLLMDSLKSSQPESPTQQTEKRSPLGKLLRVLQSSAGLALLDQVIVSGNRFATTMLVGRFCGPEGLGFYIVAFAVIVAASLSHEALLAKPFQVYSQRMQGKRYRGYTASTLVQVLCLAALASILTLSTGVFLRYWSAPSLVAEVTFALAITLPGVLVWEFVRRQAFARLQMGSAVLIDGASATIQVSTLLCLGWLDALNVFRCLVIIGLTGFLVGSVSLYKQRKLYSFQPKRLWLDTCRNWAFGKWIFAGQLVGLAQAYTVPSLLAFNFGAAATGIVMACQTIVLLSNPLLLGIANWLGPAAAKSYANGGVDDVRRLLNRSAMALFAGSLAFWVGLVIFGELLLELSFGEQYEGYGNLVGITGLSAIGFSLSICGTSGLAAIERPRLIPLGTLIGTGVTLFGFLCLVQSGGLSGAAWSLALGSVTAAAVHMVGMYYSLSNVKNRFVK